MDYNEFLSSKLVATKPDGITVEPDKINPMLFDFQRDIVLWALRLGRAAIFADCGLGKTPMQIEWANHIPGKVLILAPLAVSHQTIREAHKFGFEDISYSGDGSYKSRVTITNYERLHNFDTSGLSGIVLDESSILKNYSGKYKKMIIEKTAAIPFRLACTATPAPNDFMELGNHSEFIGSMSRQSMLSMYFIHDGGDTQKWRLKKHAQNLFWEWMCSWAVMLRKPSDLGYDDDGFVLTDLKIHQRTIISNAAQDGFLFPMEAQTLSERRSARKATITDRVKQCAELCNDGQTWLVWCNLNDESKQATAAIDGAVEITGSDSIESKEQRMHDFTTGDIRVLVTKPRIAGFGMNWQHCHNMVFLGLSDSYEQYYQAVRRCWRFGQDSTVNAHIITADIEGAVVQNIKRKETDATRMVTNMVDNTHTLSELNLKGVTKVSKEYVSRVEKRNDWTMIHGDCVPESATFEPDSIDYSIFSPPFSSLYTYSDSNRDMGNSKSDHEFWIHFGFLIDNIYNALRPGRLVSVHCMNLPTSKHHDGFIGIRDFRGDIIRRFESAGFIYHSEVCIWKDPVVAMQRTKALGLLHKQLVKDSAMSRQGLPDYVCTFRKPGLNANPVSGELDHYVGGEFISRGRLSIDVWQLYASPIWDDINQSNTLQFRSARHENDERHICPLQLDVIHRCLQLWTKENDLVFSPFAGIGSEGFEAVKMGRRFIGIELKESYFETAIKNLNTASTMSGNLFGGIE